MNRITGVAAAVILSFAAVPQEADAATLVLDGGWQEFQFGDVGSAWSEIFTFTALDTVYLAVTDAFLSGDRFEFFANGISLGLTSLPTSLEDDISSDYDAAFADPRWSSAEVMLAAGTYEITGLTVTSPFFEGGAALQLASQSLDGPDFPPTTPIPLPAAGWLMLAGLGGLGMVARRRPKAD